MSRLSILFCLLTTGLLAPSCSGGGGGGGGPGGGGTAPENQPDRIPDPETSEFQVTPAFGTPSDGASAVSVEVRLISLLGNPIAGARVDLAVSGFGNVLQPLPLTDLEGRTHGTLASLAGEEKHVSASVTNGKRITELGPRDVVFLQIPPRTYFVRSIGTDLADGRTPLSAWRTIEHALASVEAGATIHVGAGTYGGALTLQFDSASDTALLLDGDRSGSFTGDAGDVIIEGAASPYALHLVEAHNVILQGLTLRNATVGLHIQDSGGVRVLGCFAQENDYGIWAKDVDDLVIQDCRVSQNRRDGIRIASAHHSCIENNLVYHNVERGLVLRAPADGATIRFNTLFGNGGEHLSEEDVGGSGTIEENILAGGSAGAIDLQVGSGYLTSRNLVWANVEGEDKVGSSAAWPDLIEADPQFSDPFGPDGILGGIGSQDDDFRVQAWSAALDSGHHLARDVVLGSHESLATRTTRVGQELEWSAVDLPLTNLGFHYPVEAVPFVSLAPGGGRIAHAVTGEVRPHLLAWDRDHVTTTTDAPGPAFNAEVVFLEQRVSPLDRPEEIVAAQLDTGTHGEIRVQNWDGRRWSAPVLAPFQDGIPRDELADRLFDLEYEASTGRALLVTANGDESPRFRILENGRWSASRAVFEKAALPSGRVRWVELVPRRRSKELALVTLDDRRDLVVTLWDGAAFGSPHLLEANTVFTSGWRPFDAAFESLSGDLLVTWGFNIFIEETRWATLERATGTWRTGQHPSTDAVGAHVILSSDPTSDRIAAAMGEGDLDNDVIVSVWDGFAWVDTAELTLAGPIANRLLETTWIGNTGVACTVFRRQGHTGSFNMALLLAHGWRIQPDVVLPGVGRAAQVRLKSLPDRNQMLGAVLDQEGRLFGLHFDGVAMSLLNGGAPLAEGFDPAAPGRPFDVATRVPRPIPSSP